MSAFGMALIALIMLIPAGLIGVGCSWIAWALGIQHDGQIAILIITTLISWPLLLALLDSETNHNR